MCSLIAEYVKIMYVATTNRRHTLQDVHLYTKNKHIHPIFLYVVTGIKPLWWFWNYWKNIYGISSYLGNSHRKYQVCSCHAVIWKFSLLFHVSLFTLALFDPFLTIAQLINSIFEVSETNNKIVDSLYSFLWFNISWKLSKSWNLWIVLCIIVCCFILFAFVDL